MSYKERDLLSIVVERYGIRPHDDLLPSERLNHDVTQERFEAFKQWFEYPYISDHGIYSGLDLAELIHYPTADQDEVLKIWDIYIVEEDDVHLSLLKSVKKVIIHDLRVNEGKKIRAIINTAKNSLPNFVFGNEAIRDWLEERNKITIYDVETAFVAAVVFDMVCIYVNHLSLLDDEK